MFIVSVCSRKTTGLTLQIADVTTFILKEEVNILSFKYNAAACRRGQQPEINTIDLTNRYKGEETLYISRNKQ